MPCLQLTVDLAGRDPAAAEAACFALGASAVTLADAADHPILEPRPGEMPLWPAVRLTALFDRDLEPQRLGRSLAAALAIEAGALRLEPLEDRAWEREWLKDFRPMRFGRRLWICPGGMQAGAADAVVLELDPGLAFGTGTHPTTALCLEWLDGLDLAGARVLDYGCGSGVLALAALKLGAAHAHAVDIDPQALLATRENAARNGLAASVTVLPAAAPLPGRFDVIVANILAGPLAELAPLFAHQARVGGCIVLAGLLDEQAGTVTAAYRSWFDMTTVAAREGWTALAGSRKAE
jgi:ribosomal protein L11 methyltransferase